MQYSQVLPLNTPSIATQWQGRRYNNYKNNMPHAPLVSTGCWCLQESQCWVAYDEASVQFLWCKICFSPVGGALQIMAGTLCSIGSQVEPLNSISLRRQTIEQLLPDSGMDCSVQYWDWESKGILVIDYIEHITVNQQSLSVLVHLTNQNAGQHWFAPDVTTFAWRVYLNHMIL